jgi:hypothetical protein
MADANGGRMNRRELLKGLMAGGVIVAGELWMPGSKLISIPNGKVFTGVDLALKNEVSTIQIMDTMPGDRVRVLVHYDDGPDPVEYIVRNVIGNEVKIEVPLRNQFKADAEVIVAKPGDVFSRFVTGEMGPSALERNAFFTVQPSVGCRPVMRPYERTEYIIEDLS